MVMPTNLQVFEVKCQKCEWQESATVKGPFCPIPPGYGRKKTFFEKLFDPTASGKRKVKKKYPCCPVCGGDVEVNFLPVTF